MSPATLAWQLRHIPARDGLCSCDQTFPAKCKLCADFDKRGRRVILALGFSALSKSDYSERQERARLNVKPPRGKRLYTREHVLTFCEEWMALSGELICTRSWTQPPACGRPDFNKGLIYDHFHGGMADLYDALIARGSMTEHEKERMRKKRYARTGTKSRILTPARSDARKRFRL